METWKLGVLKGSSCTRFSQSPAVGLLTISSLDSCRTLRKWGWREGAHNKHGPKYTVRSLEGSRAISEPAPNPGTHQFRLKNLPQRSCSWPYASYLHSHCRSYGCVLPLSLRVRGCLHPSPSSIAGVPALQTQTRALCQADETLSDTLMVSEYGLVYGSKRWKSQFSVYSQLRTQLRKQTASKLF